MFQATLSFKPFLVGRLILLHQTPLSQTVQNFTSCFFPSRSTFALLFSLSGWVSWTCGHKSRPCTRTSLGLFFWTCWDAMELLCFSMSFHHLVSDWTHITTRYVIPLLLQRDGRSQSEVSVPRQEGQTAGQTLESPHRFPVHLVWRWKIAVTSMGGQIQPWRSNRTEHLAPTCLPSHPLDLFDAVPHQRKFAACSRDRLFPGIRAFHHNLVLATSRNISLRQVLVDRLLRIRGAANVVRIFLHRGRWLDTTPVTIRGKMRSALFQVLWQEIQTKYPEHEAHVVFVDATCSTNFEKSTSSMWLKNSMSEWRITHCNKQSLKKKWNAISNQICILCALPSYSRHENQKKITSRDETRRYLSASNKRVFHEVVNTPHPTHSKFKNCGQMHPCQAHLKMSEFYPTRNFGHFWAALKDVLPAPSPQCPLSLVSSYRNKTTKKDTGGQTMWSVFFWWKRRPATFSQKHGLCPFRCSVV